MRPASWKHAPFRFMPSLGLVGAVVVATAASVRAQPEPSFRSDCRDLRTAIESLEPTDDELLVIQVVGEVTAVQFDGALAYMTMCSSPDPQVLCITYSTGGREIGDTVEFSGTYSRPGPDHVLLDPCLHSPPAEEGAPS